MKTTTSTRIKSICLFFVFGLVLPAQTVPQPSDLSVGINQSIIIENAAGVKRISIATPEVAEAVAVSRTEVLINGKTPGETSLVVWDGSGKRAMFDVHVTIADGRPDVVKNQLQQELPGQNVSFELSNGTVFLRGLVNDVTSADRAAAIASTLGKVVNLLNVKVPDAEPQILLKVRFANVSRSAVQQLGINLISTGATNTIGGTTTGQFGSQPLFDITPDSTQTTFSDLLNIFLFRRDLNLGAAIKALEQKQAVEILAEPNLLTVSGKSASFLAGGEFPFPTLQGGGAGVGQITIQFREFGVRIHFQPVITPRGSIRMTVIPEVSSLDYANGLSVGGFTVPGLATRRIQTEVELDNGQSFVIAGLLDNRTTENLSKIPGLGNIPLLGKLFESREVQKTNNELLVLVTPELVRPIPRGAASPELTMPKPFLKGASTTPAQNPSDTGAKLPAVQSIPIETLKGWTEPQTSAEPAPAAPAGNPNGGVQPVVDSTPPAADPSAGTGKKN